MSIDFQGIGVTSYANSTYTPLKMHTGETFSVPTGKTYTLASLLFTNTDESSTITVRAKIVSASDVRVHQIFQKAEIEGGDTFGIKDEYVLHAGQKILVEISAPGVTVLGAAVEIG